MVCDKVVESIHMNEAGHIIMRYMIQESILSNGPLE